MKALRFCFLTTFYPPFNFGGDGIGIQRLAHALVRRNHSVTVVHDVDAFQALSGGSTPAAPVDDNGVEIVQLRSGIGSLSPLLTQQTGRPIMNGSKIQRLLERGRFDVINFNNISLIGGPGLLAYGAGAIKLYVAHEHWLVCPTHLLWRHNRELCTGRECFRCVLRYRRPPQLWRYTGYLERQLRHVDVFIAMSEFSRQKHREFGFPHEMEVLPHFLPDATPPLDATTGSPHPRPYFLFVGRLERIKGLDDVIPTFEHYRDADLLIAGEGGHGAILRQLAGENRRVRFLGHVSFDDLQAYYRHAIATLVPSVCFETFGMILIESFRQGTPVIARRLGPFPEIVEQAQGGEVFTTPEELRQSMMRLQHDPAVRGRLGGCAYQAFCTRWSETAVVPKYLELIRKAAQAKGLPLNVDAVSA